MKPSRAALAASILAATLLAAPAWAQHPGHAAAQPSTATPSATATGAALRDLWLGHVFWVRNVAIETLAKNEPARKAAEAEVVANARQIAAAIEPYYGKAASEKLFGLLAGHYGAIKEYLGATATGSKSGQEAAVKQLTDNAGEIAVFLAGANPNLPIETLRGLLLAHGGHHLQQIQQLRDQRYADEAKTWDAMKNHMYAIADALAGAIVKQFPTKFS